jgi:tricorn protease-like protein
MATSAPGTVALTIPFEGAVRAIAFSPDGVRVAAGGDDSLVRVRTIGTGPTLDIPSDGFVSGIAYSPDGTTLAVADSEQVYVRDAHDGKVVWQGPIRVGHSVNRLAFTPDGATVVAATNEFLATYRAADGKAGPLKELGQMIAGLDVSRDGTRVAVAMDERHGGNHHNAGAAVVFDVATLTEITRLTPDNAVYCVAYTPDGKSVLCGSADGTARRLDLVAREEPPWKIEVEARFIAADSTGEWVVLGGSDEQARLIDVETGLEKHRVNHHAAVTQVAFAPDGRRFASASIDNLLWVSTVENKNRDIYSRTTLNQVDSMRFSADSRWLGYGCFDQAVVLGNGPVQ